MAGRLKNSFSLREEKMNAEGEILTLLKSMEIFHLISLGQGFIQSTDPFWWAYNSRTKMERAFEIVFSAPRGLGNH